LNTHGRHLLVEYTLCDAQVLDDVKRIEALMTEAARAARCKIITSVFQPFEPQGVTGVVVVEESHLSIHTWPEHGYAAVDFFTCGQSPPEKAYEVLKKGLKAGRSEVMLVDRGLREPEGSLRIRSHRFHGRRKRAVEVAGDQVAAAAAQAALVGL
jgi:S-adenosylmethionine decarboxylase proenzyme